jgi:ariadne-1
VIGNTSDEIDKAWISLNTKPCPKCKLNIEKNQGCMHMTCS